MSAFTKLFGTHSERELKRIYPLVDKVESYRDAMGALSDEELRDKTKEYKERLEKGETLDDLLPEAYATVREAAKRVLGMEHYRVQNTHDFIKAEVYRMKNSVTGNIHHPVTQHRSSKHSDSSYNNNSSELCYFCTYRRVHEIHCVITDPHQQIKDCQHK